MKNKMKDTLIRGFAILLFLLNLKTGHILFFFCGMFITAIYFLSVVFKINILGELNEN